ncbi:MAG: hypothetical protein AAF728_09120 [Cyanobacteria bacterium P01_D01_bin.128]
MNRFWISAGLALGAIAPGGLIAQAQSVCESGSVVCAQSSARDGVSGDPAAIALLENGQALVANQPAEAAVQLEDALAQFEATDNWRGQNAALTALNRAYLALGDYGNALAAAQQRLAVAESFYAENPNASVYWPMEALLQILETNALNPETVSLPAPASEAPSAPAEMIRSESLQQILERYRSEPPVAPSFTLETLPQPGQSESSISTFDIPQS